MSEWATRSAAAGEAQPELSSCLQAEDRQRKAL